MTLKKPTMSKTTVETIIGRMFSFNNSLKLFHWDVMGEGSYATHIALDQAKDALDDVLDRLVETTFANSLEIKITIPETSKPENIINHCKQMYNYVDSHREDFSEKFTQAVIDDYQEAIKNLLYRLIRLS